MMLMAEDTQCHAPFCYRLIVTTQVGLSRLRPFALVACSVTSPCVQVSGVCNDPADWGVQKRPAVPTPRGLFQVAGLTYSEFNPTDLVDSEFRVEKQLWVFGLRTGDQRWVNQL